MFETPSSVIRMAGPERAQLVNDAMKQVEGTLLRLQDMSEKYRKMLCVDPTNSGVNQ